MDDLSLQNTDVFLGEAIENIRGFEDIFTTNMHKCCMCSRNLTTLDELKTHCQACFINENSTLTETVQPEKEVYRPNIRKKLISELSEFVIIQRKLSPVEKLVDELKEFIVFKRKSSKLRLAGQRLTPGNTKSTVSLPSQKSGISPKDSVCNKTFSKKSNLVTHLRVHPCADCGKGFYSVSGLQSHIKCHKEMLWLCQYCGKMFNKRGGLTVHERNHVKPYSCDICHYRCGHHFAMMRHIKAHRPFPCLSCNRKFATEDELNVHWSRKERI